MNKPFLQCVDLRKTFSDGKHTVEVLKNIQLSVQQGETIAIVGASGSGKSTLLHLLGGLDRPSHGTVTLAGHNLNQVSEKIRCQLRNQHLGFVYQFHHLLPEFNVLENVAMPLLLRHTPVAQAQEMATQILQRVGLEHRLQHRIGEISGGERQRAAIARALVSNPQGVLADEPTGNLDNRTAEKVFDVMMSLNQALNTSLIIVTHDLNIAKRMNRTFTLENGLLQTL